MLKNYKNSASKYFDAANTQGVVRKRKKAFTLVELVIVIAVIGVLATVLISSFATVQNRATQTAALEAMKSSYDAINAEDILDGDMDYANGVLLYKSKKSDKLFYVIVTNGVLGDVGVVTDKNKNESTANDYFALTKGTDVSPTNNTADQFDAKVEDKALTIYLYGCQNNISGSTDNALINSTGSTVLEAGDVAEAAGERTTEKYQYGTTSAKRYVADSASAGYIVYNQAAHIVSSDYVGFADIDANGRGGAMYDLAHTEDAAVKFISTGDQEVTTLKIGALNNAGTAVEEVVASGSVKIARTEAADGGVTAPDLVGDTRA